jgi:hypothetical protein
VTEQEFVLRFRIELLGVEPPVWRRIEVPEDYSFWDLHVAIQDAMGWEDYHLHAFRVVGSELVFGIPDEEGDDPFDTQPGWEFQIRDFFSQGTPLAVYEYDYGDSWTHEIRLEAFHPVDKEIIYPRCLEGSRRCPPEDCGGIHGYRNFLRVIADPSDPEHESMLEWIGGPFDPEDFDPTRIHFDDPAERWRIAFEDEQT